MSADFFDSLKQFTKDIRQHVANKKVREGDVAIVGKKNMGFNVYKTICELMMKEQYDEYIFARAHFILEWTGYDDNGNDNGGGAKGDGI